MREGTTRAIIGVKRMGELESKPFQSAARSKFSLEEADEKAMELCSLWEENLRDSGWHPFKIIVDKEGNCKVRCALFIYVKQSIYFDSIRDKKT